MKYIFLIFIFLISINFCFAYGYGVFTDFYFNAQTIGVGENEYISYDPLLNSAFLTVQKGRSFSFGYTDGYFQQDIGYISYFGNNIKKYTVGVSVYYLDKYSLVKYNENGDSIGEFFYNEIQPNVMLAYSTNDNISVGYGISFQLGTIDSVKYNYFSQSISAILKYSGFVLGASVNNKGITMTDNYGAVTSAMRWSLGSSIELVDFKSGIALGGVYSEYSYITLGGEYLIKDILQLRLGYKLVFENVYDNGLKFGFGIIRKKMNINYSVQFKEYIGTIQTFNLQFNI